MLCVPCMGAAYAKALEDAVAALKEISFDIDITDREFLLVYFIPLDVMARLRDFKNCWTSKTIRYIFIYSQNIIDFVLQLLSSTLACS